MLHILSTSSSKILLRLLSFSLKMLYLQSITRSNRFQPWLYPKLSKYTIFTVTNIVNWRLFTCRCFWPWVQDSVRSAHPQPGQTHAQLRSPPRSRGHGVQENVWRAQSMIGSSSWVPLAFSFRQDHCSCHFSLCFSDSGQMHSSPAQSENQTVKQLPRVSLILSCKTVFLLHIKVHSYFQHI